ncbi:RWD-domain-containing protein [Trichodelitschia bisporula]|uniref:RWD-domain-containing protein n=1 Tax=Trichodelitschia bisporula TaxID=703511 RepID=A0A6G1HZM3_9PEZI|nr:RWD-domain-containing protein [Trichodelitschia bisporula]
MGVEEQQEEREVLESIFPDEITSISDTEFRISTLLDVDPVKEGEEPPTIILSVQYPPDYPDEAPNLDITAPPNAPKYAHLDINEDKTTLLSALESTVEENLGMAMVFTLVSTLKDAAELLIAERKKATQALLEIAAAKAEEEENRKFAGQAVTRESFLAWRENFRAEMEEAELRAAEEALAEDKKKRGAKAEEAKLTGKQLWEGGLAGRGDEGEEEGDVDALADIAKLKLAAA